MMPDDDQAEEERPPSQCRHGSEPEDCLKRCRCGHSCDDHYDGELGACAVVDCRCNAWSEPKDA